MGWTLRFAKGSEQDFALIFDHLFESYLGFGEPVELALDHAQARVFELRAEADRILTAPHRGRSTDEILPGTRALSLGKATYWFTVDEAAETVVILAVFFGGQETRRKMLLRLLQHREG